MNSSCLWKKRILICRQVYNRVYLKTTIKHKIYSGLTLEKLKNLMQKFPHPERAIIHIDKLTDYCLNPEHSSGKHKARVFKSSLNLDIEDAETLRNVLLDVVHEKMAVPTKRNAYGQKYVIDFKMSHSGRTAEIRTVWIVRDDENFPRFVTCYVLR